MNIQEELILHAEPLKIAWLL